MRSILTTCPVCKSLKQDTLFPSFYDTFMTPLQDVVLCNDCGCVFRNPHIPEICQAAYTDVDNWGSENPDFTLRFDDLSKEIAHEVPLKANQLYMDIGAGPGWLTQRLSKYYVGAKAVILEPSFKVAEHAKQRNPHASVLPAMLSDAVLPKQSFSLITACGVDYLFQDHRADMETIFDLLVDGGVFYLERNVFVDSPAYYQQPIFDLDDLFGLNARINTWFLRDQLGEYLSEFFEVTKRTDRVFDTTFAPYSRLNILTGYYCKRRPGGERKAVNITNRYNESLTILQQRAEHASIEDLQLLRAAGCTSVAVAGQGEEAVTLIELIKKHDIFSLEMILNPLDQIPLDNPLHRQYGNRNINPVDAILLASVTHQDNYRNVCEQSGLNAITLPCFRQGAPFFAGTGSIAVQVKAFLPYYLSHIDITGESTAPQAAPLHRASLQTS